MKQVFLDHRNLLYFHFATPNVQEFETLNSVFQETKADPHYLYQQIFLHEKSLRSRLYDGKEHQKKP